jgi:hypothetical protein
VASQRSRYEVFLDPSLLRCAFTALGLTEGHESNGGAAPRADDDAAVAALPPSERGAGSPVAGERRDRTSSRGIRGSRRRGDGARRRLSRSEERNRKLIARLLCADEEDDSGRPTSPRRLLSGEDAPTSRPEPDDVDDEHAMLRRAAAHGDPVAIGALERARRSGAMTHV